MSSFVINGGRVNEEGHGKPWYNLFRQGYSTGLTVAQRGAGANMSVDIAIGAGSLATAAGIDYYGWTDGTTNTTVNTADPTNPRRDIVVAYINLSLISSAVTNNTGALLFKSVAGTPAASPSDPSDPTIQSSVGAGNPFTKLARLTVGAGVTSVTTPNIADLRVPMALQMPYLYGGSSNTKGHLVPNIADDTVALLAASQTFTNKLFSTGTTFADNIIPASGLATNAITLGYAQSVSNFTLSTSQTTPTLITGLTVTVTIPTGGRRVEITGFCGAVTFSAGIAVVEIWDGAINSGTQLNQANVASSSSSGIVHAIVTPSAGSSKTYSIALANSGLNNTTAGASTVQPAFILVKVI